MAEEQQKREDENNEIKEMGTLNMKESGSKYGIQLLTIIGEIEGHDSVSGNTKATKYEHLLPRLAQIEEDDETDGVLILLNTLGGDVEAGLAIAEMIASLQQAYGVARTWGKSFNRRPAGCVGRLFLYCADGYDDRSSCAFYRNVYRSDAKLSKYGKNAGSYYKIHCVSF